MKAIALALGALLTVGATAASAQWEDRPYPYNDPSNGNGWGENRWKWRDDSTRDNRYYYGLRDWRGAGHECWNPRAGRFEIVRDGEYQDDLDYSRCHPVVQYEYRYEPRYRYYRY
jgi:hypothetical protein